MSGRLLAPLSATLILMQPLMAAAQVTSFNGRTGVVAAASGDYTCSQVTNCGPTNATTAWSALQNFGVSQSGGLAEPVLFRNSATRVAGASVGIDLQPAPGSCTSTLVGYDDGAPGNVGLLFYTCASNTRSIGFTLNSAGSLRLDAYGSGTLVTDGSGNITAASAATERSNLGLGTAATQNTGTSGANVPLLNASNTWGAAQIGCWPTGVGCSSPKIGAVFDAIGPLVGSYPGGAAENNQFDAVAYNGFSQFQAERRDWDPTAMQFKQVLANEVVGSFLGAAYDDAGSDPSDAGMLLYATENQVHNTNNGMGLELDYTPNGSTALTRGLSVSPQGNGGVTLGGGLANNNPYSYAGPTDMGAGTLHAASDIVTNNHLRSGGASPTLSTCGTGSTVNGTDVSGKVTNCSAITACTVTFAHALNTPTCIVQDYATATPTPFLASLSGSGFTVNWGAAYSGSWFYMCLDH